MFAALLTKVFSTVTISYLIAVRKHCRRSRPRGLDQLTAPPSGEQLLNRPAVTEEEGLQHRVPTLIDELTPRDTNTADIYSSLSLIVFFKWYSILSLITSVMISSLFSQLSRLIVILHSYKMVPSLRDHLRLLFSRITADMFIKLPGCCWESHFVLSKRRGGKCCLKRLKSFLFVLLNYVVLLSAVQYCRVLEAVF